MNNKFFRVSFYLYGKSHVKADGKISICCRIHLGGERLAIGSTGVCVTHTLWDPSTHRVIGKTAEARYLNYQLDNIETDLKYIFRRLEFSDQLSLERIRAEYLKEEEITETFMQYFDAYNKRIAEEIGHGRSYASVQKYRVTRRRFYEYLTSVHHRKDIKFSELGYSVITGFEHYLMTVVKMANNSAMHMLKLLKTIIISAQKDGFITRDPYQGVRMHFDPVDRGFLTDAEVERIMSKNFDNERLEHVRDIFIFSCFTGLAYIDVRNLKTDNIVELDGQLWIITRRQKTNIESNVLLMEIPIRLINKYKGKAKDNFVFPTMSNQKQNQYLKEIADLCGINKRLTCHLARHTFATMALSKGVPIESVSRMLGHTNIKTTQLYARITNQKIRHDMESLMGKMDGFNNSFNKAQEHIENREREEEIKAGLLRRSYSPVESLRKDERYDIDTPEKEVKRPGRPKKVADDTILKKPVATTSRKRTHPRAVASVASYEKANIVATPQKTHGSQKQIQPEDAQVIIKNPDTSAFFNEDTATIMDSLFETNDNEEYDVHGRGNSLRHPFHS